MDVKIINEIQERYAKESSSCSNLSCGSNLDYLKIHSGEQILDLGCGKGSETIQAAVLASPEGNATGLDITQSMVESARRNANERGISNVRFLHGDIENLPFNDDSFNGVMSNCAINHAQNKNKVYCEIYRVLKEEGRFVISDAVTKKPLPPEVRDDPEAWAQCFGGAITENEYMSTIAAAGFKNINILKRREYIKNSYDFISLTILAFK